jgi:hypothetical protein
MRNARFMGTLVFLDLQVFDRTAKDQIVTRAHDAEIVLTTRTNLSAQILGQFKKSRISRYSS